MSEFRDQVILITGATGGLGEIVTRNFVDGGAHVVAVAVDWPHPPESHRVVPLTLDLVEPEQCRKAVTQTLQEFQRIDALIHLVGGFAGGTTIAATTDETWDHMMDINLHATFNLCREVMPHMMASGRGRIIAIGSKAGSEPAPRFGAYHVSKAAMHALIRVLALECKGSGITANAILPSTIDTPWNRESMPEADFNKWVKPGAIAQLIMYLASEAAASVNGALIPIYGES
ncbi:MAG: SDR family NAD(P)-dependent oxidoreductase [Acidobacteria bacterium]|nr:SDR family NAD(P)-dependent oxidoreductase [Acidobacteriota bacterium]